MAEATGWVGPDDGLLAIDRNNDGIVTDHNELFGTENIDGFDILATLDSNNDNVIDSSDTEFSNLLVWVDANSDGHSQSGELYSLSDLNIVSIELSYSAADYSVAGNAVRSVSSYTLGDNSTMDIADVWFAYNNYNTEYVGDYSLNFEDNGAVSRRLLTIPEPRLMFDNDQTLENPKDELLLFGPDDKPIGIQYGIIGTPDGIERFKKWAKKLQGVVVADPNITSSVTFPGFETIFRTPWNTEPRVTLSIEEKALKVAVKNTDSHQRVFDTVDIFANQIRRWVKEEDPKVSLWFVIVPEYVWEHCRPNSTISKTDGIEPEIHLSHNKAMSLLQAPDFFDEVNEAAEKHLYHNHFHNQLKAKLLDCEAVIQIVRESTIAPYDFVNKLGKPKRKVQDEATIAWNLSTAIYYQSGARPWSLADIRDGVCYIGLVFKRTNNPDKQYEACCGAQMFLHTGEGMVFKGAIGEWASDKLGDYHLTEDKAAEIIKQCISAYKNWHGKNPKEVFIHGRTNFNQEEIKGFQSAVPEETAITGIQIRRPNDLKLFREGRRAILRGLALKLNNRNAFLWTSGYIPQLMTYPGREVPTPLKIKVVFGKTRIEQVLEDIMGLTKLNFNTCIYGDGFPVTLRFAEDVGEILTAIPTIESKPLPFRHYI